ncbi:Inositol hexakisphosphate and diphosphoinositol-pentakisphosphate kinase [Zancudomyces culisetae]|uniref:Inositol hexakisphosphate and diphosphoinositol-pentakisphosphate kinase n=1 Tax=Zancudomyces culisetae TaxID=1213189 RepID=A0A1R1PEU6_ZANCU|nr:Inositol hexakisphosphate and diphosphoinositol-pentakisphosphate kinase [Zancudomyces culisetae]|eukprot:OMH79448.1 Inositol hexakisphosphate and diphosphoinositol-pentakisphosphate kinase [Zancudomyces culisetae]
MRKPFVEKPVDAEDHNIYIYYPKDQGGGVRKLFRKVGNKSSKYYPELSEIRQDGSYIYEEFIDTNNSVDVKAYILGNDHIYAETRKSPVVDGVVRRNAEGKEVRHKTTLSEKEVEMAKKINEGFGQKVCGFDLLRDNDRSMVMDVNGWSFVKGKNEYYDSAAFTLDKWFIDAMKNSWMSKFVRGSDMAEEDEPDYESQWTLKGIFSVCRHADRTPKQKIKYNIRSQKIMEYLKNGKNEVILKKEEELSRFLEIVKSELVNGTHDSHSDNNSLRAIQDILYRKMKLVGTKIQLKSNFSKKSGELVDVQVIIKWGGECTHAGLIQAQDLAETIKKDLKLLNPKLLDNIKLYKSSERRVAATVDVFHKVVCPQVVRIEQDPDAENYIRTCPEMLDDSSDAKPEMEIAKTHLRNYFNYRGPILTNPYATPDIDFMKTLKENNITFNSGLGENGCNNPREFIKSIGYLLNKLVGIMNRNFTLLSPEKIKEIQPEWCCYETPELFRERWIKMLEDFRFETMEDVIFEPTKIGELHDSLKYDALHNYRFLEKIFCPIDSYIESTSLSELSSSSYKNGSGSCGGGGGGEEWGWWREGGEERKKQGEKEIGGGGTAQLDGTHPTNGTVLHTNAVSKRTEMRRSISTGPVITHQSTRNARSMTKKTTVGSEEAKATDVGNTSINVTSNIYTGKMPHFGIIGGANSNGSEFEDELDHSNLSNSTAALMRNNGKRGSISLLLSSLNMDAEANKNKNENGRPNEDKRKKQHIALEDTIKEGAGNKSSASINSNENYPQMYQNDLRDLYFKTKILYNFVTPREFGISGHQKHVIGIKGSRLLLEKIVKNLEIFLYKGEPFVYAIESCVRGKVDNELLDPSKPNKRVGLPNAFDV